jgi:6-phospho-3-hexuloisomerase
MHATHYFEQIVNELKSTLIQISDEEAEQLVEAILKAQKLFIAGAGRSGFMVKAFAMRLMHMGFNVYVVGETITPNLEKDDLLIIGSGSGETASLIAMATKARSMEAKIALITIFPESTIGKIATIKVYIPAPTPKVKSDKGIQSIQPMGSLFEQSLLLFLDTTILLLMHKLSNHSENMFNKHANLE